MEIFVNNGLGTNFRIHVEASDRLRDLKAKIQAETGERNRNQAVVYGRKQMRMNWRLSSYGLTDGCTVYLFEIFFPQSSSVLEAHFFVDLENKDALQRIPIHCRTGRQWSMVVSGLNIEGKCRSMSCEAFGERVISPQGFGSFNTRSDKAPCPMCGCTVKATTCGFVDCQWMYTGRKKGSEADINSEWQLADEGYERFREAGNLVDWEALVISVKLNDESQECHMCLRDMSFKEMTERLACGCRFHSACVAEWKERETRCPNCRSEMSTSQSPLEVSESKPKRRKSFWRLCQGRTCFQVKSKQQRFGLFHSELVHDFCLFFFR